MFLCIHFQSLQHPPPRGYLYHHYLLLHRVAIDPFRYCVNSPRVDKIQPVGELRVLSFSRSPNNRRQFLHLLGGDAELGQDFIGNVGRFGQVVAASDAVVLEPGDVEGVVAFGDLLTGEAAEAAGFALILALGLAVGVVAEGVHEVLKMIMRQRGALAEAGHVGAQVVDPDFLGVALVLLATGEEQHVGLDALGVEDAGGQAQDGVQVALVHQVGADLLAVAVVKQHVVGQHHGGPAAGFEATGRCAAGSRTACWWWDR